MISVEIKYSNFTSVSHQMQLTTPANTTEQLYKNACLLFKELWNTNPVRLLGIRTSKLTREEEPIQLSLFDSFENEKQLKAEKAMDLIKDKFGASAIVRGSFLKGNSSNEP
jgi:DNA polymerase-4